MSDIKQADAMLRMAYRDLKALGGMLDADVFADEIFGFHVQQMVEKCLKAWMCVLGITYPFTHQINRLLGMAGKGLSCHLGDQFNLHARAQRNLCHAKGAAGVCTACAKHLA